MIPKKIHYCWFGRGEKNPLIQHCMDSWKRVLPDYEIVEWNEDTFDVSSILWTKQAYEAKKWAFVSDYVRLYALFSQGGIYFDTDVEVLKPLDQLLDTELLLGFESNDMLTTAVIGSVARDPLIGSIIAAYQEKQFIKQDGTYDTIPNPYVLSHIIQTTGIRLNGKKQTVNGIQIHPSIVFSPNNFTRIWEKPSQKSYTIHYFDQSWTGEKHNTNTFVGKVRRYAVGVLRNIIGTENTRGLKNRFFDWRKQQRANN